MCWFSYQKEWFPNLAKLCFGPISYKNKISRGVSQVNSWERFMFYRGGEGGYKISCSLYLCISYNVFPPLVLVACFPAPDASYLFPAFSHTLSCPLRRLHVFPPLALFTCFVTYFVTVSCLPAVITSHVILCMYLVFSSLTLMIVIAKHSMFHSHQVPTNRRNGRQDNLEYDTDFTGRQQNHAISK